MTSQHAGVLMTLALLCSPALADEAGTRVTVSLAKSQGELPDPEKLVQAVSPLGAGERQVVVKRKATDAGGEVSMDLWGRTLTASEIPGALRAAFPVLKTAQIQVSVLDPASRPTLDPLPEAGAEVTTTTTPDGKVRKVIKKRVVETK